MEKAEIGINLPNLPEIRITGFTKEEMLKLLPKLKAAFEKEFPNLQPVQNLHTHTCI